MDECTDDYKLDIQETWDPLDKLVNISNPLFDRTLFLFGYDYSCNIYLIRGDYHSIIDSGNDYTAYMQLVDLGFKTTDIKKIALTHGHHDHTMGVVEMFRGYRGFGTPDIEIIIHEAGPVEYKKMVQDLGCHITEVKGGETIELSGFELEVIHTPGHTIDGLCFYHAPTRTLFSGDTVLPHAMAELDTKAGGGRMDHYLYALRTLLKKDIEHVLPGHGGVAPLIGRKVVEETYHGLIKRTLGKEVPLLAGANQLAQGGLLEESLFYVNKELADNPENFRAFEFKAFLLNDLGRSQEALEWFNKVLDQNPDHLHALMGKGCSLMGLGRYEESLSLFDEVLKRHSQSSEAQIYKGMALYLAGRLDEAMDLPAFQQEFASRLKTELEKLAQEKQPEVGS